MRHQKALDQVDRYATADWGAFTRYLEIADDGWIWRQVDLYANGYGLRYDREHWVDSLGQLGDARQPTESHAEQSSQWTLLEIDSPEFESAWELAAHAPNQPQQYDASSWANVPAVLHLTQEYRSRLPPWIARLFEENK